MALANIVGNLPNLLDCLKGVCSELAGKPGNLGAACESELQKVKITIFWGALLDMV